jgi:hypothetical protein
MADRPENPAPADTDGGSVARAEKRVIHWTSARAYGVPGAEVFDALDTSTTRVAGVGLGAASVASVESRSVRRAAAVNPNDSSTTDAPATGARLVEAQLDVALSSPNMPVDLHITSLGSLGERSTASLLAEDSQRGPTVLQPVVIRPRRGFEGGNLALSDKVRRAAGWTLVGGGLASSALATYFAVVANQHDVDDPLRNSSTCRTPSCRVSNNAGRPDTRAMSNALGGAGVAVLATGGLFLMTTPVLSFGQRTRVGAAVRSTNTGFLVMTGEW